MGENPGPAVRRSLGQRIELTNSYVLIPEGINFDIFHTKLHNSTARPACPSNFAIGAHHPFFQTEK